MKVQDPTPKDDWFSDQDRDYANTNITSHIDMPGKILKFGTLGKRISGFQKKVDEFGDEIDKFGENMAQEEPEDLNIAMPGADSSDEENTFQN